MTGPGQPLRILVVDDHALYRRGVRDILEEEPDFRVVAEASSGEEALQWVRQLRPHGLDLVLMDLDMPHMDGVEATRRILALDPALPVVMLTVSALEHDMLEAVRAGAVGFLGKNLAPSAMVQTLREFFQEGALPMSRQMASHMLSHLHQLLAAAQDPITPTAAAQGLADEPLEGDVQGPLTAREREVLELVARGDRDRDIARHLVLTENTVKKHVQNILRKLNARNRTEAVARYREMRR